MLTPCGVPGCEALAVAGEDGRFTARVRVGAPTRYPRTWLEVSYFDEGGKSVRTSLKLKARTTGGSSGTSRSSGGSSGGAPAPADEPRSRLPPTSPPRPCSPKPRPAHPPRDP